VNKAARSEQEIFSDLAALCCRPGYIHAVAYLCFRDNVILYEGNLKKSDMSKMFSPLRLIRTEINTLLGLMIKADIDWSLPAPKIVQEYIDATERLLEELHHCLAGEFWLGSTKEAVENGFNPFGRGAAFIARRQLTISNTSTWPSKNTQLTQHGYRQTEVSALTKPRVSLKQSRKSC
jgi:hypothetical protein